MQTEKAMAPHSSTLAWKIPWMEEPGRLQSMGSIRVRHDWTTSLSLFTFMHWRRKWQATPVFLLGESQGQSSLVGCRLWGGTESDTTEELTPQKDGFFNIADWNSKMGKQIPGVTGKFGLGVQNEAGQRLIRVLPRERTGHSQYPLPTTQEKTLHINITRWSILKSD